MPTPKITDACPVPEMLPFVAKLVAGELECWSCWIVDKCRMAIVLVWYEGKRLPSMPMCHEHWKHFRDSYSRQSMDPLWDTHGFDGQHFYSWLMRNRDLAASDAGRTSS